MGLNRESVDLMGPVLSGERFDIISRSPKAEGVAVRLELPEALPAAAPGPHPHPAGLIETCFGNHHTG